jgi:hypothetical protein
MFGLGTPASGASGEDLEAVVDLPAEPVLPEEPLEASV